jgi:hypothetical protein
MNTRVLGAGVVLALIASGCGSDNSAPTKPSNAMPEPAAEPTQLEPGMVVGTTTLANGSTPQGGQGQVIDDISCDNDEQVQYHVHAHLSLFVNGEQIAIPLAIGIQHPVFADAGKTFALGGTCLYWLHTHDQTGIIHIEAPAQGTFTLGQFFDIWGEPLSTSNVAGFEGPVTAVVDGTAYTGDLRAIAITPPDPASHQQITLMVGTPPDTIPTYLFPEGY